MPLLKALYPTNKGYYISFSNYTVFSGGSQLQNYCCPFIKCEFTGPSLFLTLIIDCLLSFHFDDEQLRHETAVTVEVLSFEYFLLKQWQSEQSTELVFVLLENWKKD